MKHFQLFITLSVLSIPIGIFSQNTKLDSVQKIEEVVITGQYSRQSVKKSVFEVTVINQAAIEQNAANNLADLLNQNLNIQIDSNAEEGKSTVNLFGLDGQYFKIMRDGIPMVSEDGFGNNIDLTQINLDNVKQIEIVEGSMGVQYGANAVSGVINIITKTNSKYKWSISSSLQEETAGNEYSWFDKGKHIQKIQLAHNISNNFYTSIHFSRNHFSGYLGDRKGKNYFGQDDLRGHEWLPKEQTRIKGLLNYHKKNTQITYKTSFSKVLLNRYDRKVRKDNINGFYEYRSINDKDYLTNQMSHDIIMNTKIDNKIQVSFYAAYQEQIKKRRNVVYNISNRESARGIFKNYLFKKVYFSKATLSNFTKDKPFDFQLGIVYNLENGYGSSEASLSIVDAAEEIYSIDTFISGEYHISSASTLRPGMRYSIQSDFENQWQYSLSFRQLLQNDFQFRSVVGSSYRTPNFDELYTYYVKNNHDITGNRDLLPERSYSAYVNLKKNTYFNNGKLTNKLKVGWLHVKDRIDLVVVSPEPELAFKYINVDKHTSLDYSLENTYSYTDFTIQLNATLLGISESINSIEESESYLYTLIFNSNLSYYFKKINTSFSLSYKYNGKQSEFIQDSNDAYVKNTRDAYSWMDTSFKTSFLKKKLTTSIGVRNLTNVTTVNSSYTSNGSSVHSDANSRLLGYGRSYFIKLKYNLNI